MATAAVKSLGPQLDMFESESLYYTLETRTYMTVT